MTIQSPRFREIISTEAELEAVLGQPNAHVMAKAIKSLDSLCRRFIARSPFVLIGSTDIDGHVDVSPKGDPSGFVHVIDANTLAIPERPGNRRADTFRNLLHNPRVGLIFLVPGKRETLRIRGDAIIIRDLDWRQRLVVNGRTPDLAMIVTVREAFFHCGKCTIRSGLWEPAKWPSLEGLPTLAETAIAHAKMPATISQIQQRIDDDERSRLY